MLVAVIWDEEERKEKQVGSGKQGRETWNVEKWVLPSQRDKEAIYMSSEGSIRTKAYIAILLKRARPFSRRK